MTTPESDKRRLKSVRNSRRIVAQSRELRANAEEAMDTSSDLKDLLQEKLRKKAEEVSDA
jgi:hypothetical protein